ncbi:MAG: diguanylate cyclase [Myxococcales bacterium]|nr:diguanylate cyclase [Myxococcales bacterium]
MDEPASLPTRVHRQQAALLAIGAEWRRYEGDVDGAVRLITETAVTALDVERASVWLLDEGRTKIFCEDLYERAARRHSRGVELPAAAYPHYFAALGSEEVIAASDAHRDPRTSEFSAGYLTPLGIGAMLDAPIRSGGRVVGVLCHEHVGGERGFHVDEQNTANYLASLVSLALELRRRLESERAVAESRSLLRAAFEATSEGILAVDPEGSVVAYNQRFVEMWGVPAELLGRGGDAGPRLQYLAGQTTAPEAFVTRVRAIFSEPEAESSDLFELRDGRSVERTSRPQRLGGKVIGRVWSYRDVTQRRRMEAALRASEEQLRELASRDALTGLYNRRHLHQHLEEELVRSRRSGRGFAVAMLDVDHFKRINDEHGHQTGDEVLKAFAADVLGRLRRTDSVGRWGGEEFLLVLPETARDGALHVLDELRAHVARPREGLPRFTVSVGVAAFPEDGAELLPLIARADARLYEAKAAGRDAVR